MNFFFQMTNAPVVMLDLPQPLESPRRARLVLLFVFAVIWFVSSRLARTISPAIPPEEKGKEKQ
jgi:hypothetical protein